MSLDQAVYSRLANNSGVSALVSTRIYPLAAPASASLPFIVYQRVSTQREHYQQGADGLARPRVQIDCYSTTPIEVDQVAEAVRNALDGFQGTVSSVRILVATLVDDADDLAEDFAGGEVHVRRRRMDFLIWHAESAPTL